MNPSNPLCINKFRLAIWYIISTIQLPAIPPFFPPMMMFSLTLWCQTVYLCGETLAPTETAPKNRSSLLLRATGLSIQLLRPHTSLLRRGSRDQQLHSAGGGGHQGGAVIPLIQRILRRMRAIIPRNRLLRTVNLEITTFVVIWMCGKLEV